MWSNLHSPARSYDKLQIPRMDHKNKMKKLSLPSLSKRRSYQRDTQSGRSNIDAVSRYNQGDYLRVELPSATTDRMSVWIVAHHCDDKHGIVFGTVDRQLNFPERFGRLFSPGAKLAASYFQVREHRATSSPWERHGF